MNPSRRAFTLVELLIVIAVIAILSVIVMLILNPAELIKQSRDANRVSDLSTLKTALSFYETQGGSAMGDASTSYVSLIDPSATSSAGDQCQGLSLNSLPAGWTYHCAASSTYKNIDGTGWIPINFSASQLKPPISGLPVDPVNSASTGYYFTYTTGGGTYELTASLESQKYATTTSADGGQYADLFEAGSNLALAPTDYAGGSGGGGSCAGGHSGYSCSRAITMSNSNVSGTLSNFPMLFSGTYSYLAASSSGGDVQNTNGYDIAFTSDSGCSSKLNFEQESYTNSTGNIIDWVNVPSITGGTVIYLCYGNGSTTTSQQNVAGTWDGSYIGVWHLAAAGNATTTDATANSNDMTNTAITGATALIDGGGSFNGSTAKASIPYNSSFDFSSSAGTNALTASGWFNIGGGSSTIVDNYSGAGSGWSLGVAQQGAALKLNNYARDPSFSQTIGTTALSTGIWYYGTFVYNDGGKRKLYLNGVLDASSAVGAGMVVTSTRPVTIGAPGAINHAFDGLIDEVRISNNARSSQWILTEYNNQSSPSTFYTVGAAM